MSQGVFQSINKIGDETFSQSTTITTKSQHITDINVPAAKVGSLTTRTSDTVGTLTMTAGHGLTTGINVDIYWTGGRRLGVAVGTVATNSVPISGGTGDNLPSANTSINVSPVLTANVQIDVDNIKAIVISSAGRGTAIVRGSDDPILTKEFSATGIYSWYLASGVTSPFDVVTGGNTVELIMLSNGETAAKKLRVGFLID